jgi:hypothetical protein
MPVILVSLEYKRPGTGVDSSQPELIGAARECFVWVHGHNDGVASILISDDYVDRRSSSRIQD